jgi:hypothetical protein
MPTTDYIRSYCNTLNYHVNIHKATVKKCMKKTSVYVVSDFFKWQVISRLQDAPRCQNSFLLTQFGSFIILEIEKRPPGSIRHSAQKQNSEAAPSPPPPPPAHLSHFFSRGIRKRVERNLYLFSKRKLCKSVLGKLYLVVI